MPPLSNWNTPFVLPSEKSSKTLRIGQGNCGQIQIDLLFFADAAHGVVDHRQRRQSQKIHLEETDRLQILHAVLGCDFILVRLLQRDKFHQRLWER